MHADEDLPRKSIERRPAIAVCHAERPKDLVWVMPSIPRIDPIATIPSRRASSAGVPAVATVHMRTAFPEAPRRRNVRLSKEGTESPYMSISGRGRVARPFVCVRRPRSIDGMMAIVLITHIHR